MTKAISDLVAMCQAMKPLLASRNPAVEALRGEVMRSVALPIYEKAIEAAGTFGGEDQDGARRGDFSTYKEDRDRRFTIISQRVAARYQDDPEEMSAGELTTLAYMDALNEEAATFIDPALAICEIVNGRMDEGDDTDTIIEALRVFFAIKYLGLQSVDVLELKD